MTDTIPGLQARTYQTKQGEAIDLSVVIHLTQDAVVRLLDEYPDNGTSFALWCKERLLGTLACKGCGLPVAHCVHSHLCDAAEVR